MLQPVLKPEYVRDLGPVDATPLAAMVARLSDTTWDREDARKENRFVGFHHTSHVIFRFTPGNRDASDYYDTPAWNVWRSLLQPVMDQAVQSYGFKSPAFPKAMLARLQAGHIIDRHLDGEGSNLQAHKIHVPLQTNPHVVFSVKDRDFHLSAGHAWEVNNIDAHGVANNGAEDRIHFIFEVYDDA